MACGMPPANKHYLYYGFMFNQGKLWQSYEYAWQKHQYNTLRHQTIGFNVQHGRGHFVTGLVLEGRVPMFKRFTQKRIENRRTRKLQTLLRYHLFPVVAINPNVHFFEQETSINIKPRLGIMFKSNRGNFGGGISARLSYGIDIPGSTEHFHAYNRQNWQLQIGINIPGKRKW